ncbi:MAG: outer membrane protein assembly factor BamD [Proteobacteria bacterium]|nr:outer membrane protein assembly factor BamD [Pseudomonadota bacterium]
MNEFQPLTQRLPVRVSYICLAIFFNVLFVLAISCEHHKSDTLSDAASFIKAKETYDKKHYTDAIELLEEFTFRFPYSEHVVTAQLLTADAYFDSKQFLLAASSYQNFSILHPYHSQKDYAIFKTGLSYWHLAPKSQDRDPTYTQKALEYWQRLFRDFPESEYQIEAKSLYEEGRKQLVGHQLKVAKFYCRTKNWLGCVYLLDKFIKKFQDSDPDQVKIAAKIGLSALKHLDHMVNKGQIIMSNHQMTKNLSPRSFKELLNSMLVTWQGITQSST